MRGPAPKPAALRQRRNRKSNAVDLTGKPVRAKGIPELFDRLCDCGGLHEAPEPGAKRKRGRPRKARPPCARCLGTGILPWHPLTMAWWRDVWVSEVAGRYLRVDLHGLYRLAVMVDRYWKESDQGFGVRELGAEIRLQQQAYGITPLDRTRLQWEVETPEKKEKEQKEPPSFNSKDVLRALA